MNEIARSQIEQQLSAMGEESRNLLKPAMEQAAKALEQDLADANDSDAGWRWLC
jgi:hypothetical protein